MYINREPSAYLHSLISLLEIIAIKSVISSLRLSLTSHRSSENGHLGTELVGTGAWQ